MIKHPDWGFISIPLDQWRVQSLWPKEKDPEELKEDGGVEDTKQIMCYIHSYIVIKLVLFWSLNIGFIPLWTSPSWSRNDDDDAYKVFSLDENRLCVAATTDKHDKPVTQQS